MKCKLCGNDVDELRTIRVQGKPQRACEECAERVAETAEIEDAATGAMREMMGYRGR
jgi:ribosome-binding protein aMBF1 (putative translation factor)